MCTFIFEIQKAVFDLKSLFCIARYRNVKGNMKKFEIWTFSTYRSSTYRGSTVASCNIVPGRPSLGQLFMNKNIVKIGYNERHFLSFDFQHTVEPR